MVRWEYAVTDANQLADVKKGDTTGTRTMVAIMNAEGRDGWELVQIIDAGKGGTLYVFKRPLTKAREREIYAWRVAAKKARG